MTFVVSLFLAWTLIPSNTAGRTKRTLTSSFTFVGYCVGNMIGSQIFRSKDAVSSGTRLYSNERVLIEMTAQVHWRYDRLCDMPLHLIYLDTQLENRARVA